MYFPTVTPGLLGTAVIWGKANECTRMNLIVDDEAGVLALAASAFREPAPIVWIATDRSISRASPVLPELVPPPECVRFTADLVEAGLDVVADHGVWLGEINGLEVARVGLRDGECSMDIGVGAYDQFASAALNMDRDHTAELARVVSMIRPHRIKGAEPHAIGRLVRSRWLRAQVMRDPDLIGMDSVNPIPLLRERPGLLENQPAAGLALRGSQQILVVFTVGVDLGVAETAAGLAGRHALSAGSTGVDEVIVVVPTRDLHQRIIDSVDALALPSTVVAIEGEWAV
ncbi:MAG: hypothetical protein R8J94_11945 [Acidimicrobiia bacterium]|nr:hypothetical protein [Acidimicrobiia bacterium]